MSMHQEAATERSVPSRFRFRIRTLLLVALFTALVCGWIRDRTLLNEAREIGRIYIEVYNEPVAFARRLGSPIRGLSRVPIQSLGRADNSDNTQRRSLLRRQALPRNLAGLVGGPVQIVDFDDIDTEENDVAAFDANRYRAKGIVITGTDGQYVGRTFGQPSDFTAASQPNAYAPGPVGKNPGGNRTDVTFVAGQSRGLVSGFGANFIDVDFPMIMPSGLELYDQHGNLIASYDNIIGPGRTPVFCGLVAVDERGNPIPIIANVKLKNGTGWPGVDAGETVTMDDFLFDRPVPMAK